MSPANRHFGSAAAGQVPSAIVGVSAIIMGKPSNGIEAIADAIGHGISTAGRIDLTDAAIKANAAQHEKATPGGGLTADGSESVIYKPAEDNDQLFSRGSDPAPRTPAM